ncbi:DNA adenine methylase [Williamsoniiplasma lucivorax]|uniref:Restriction endonuclease subunit M n=1 Tax=Williamsoniiplasma lucivorax TaxID=209274 RepID=A0A2S5RDY1_9MOLU|nr:DNA adenine methylase [Williamsoniiplasma lucivorax]PPE05422.1 restriction endonuclease subunit M [Williamsoniiplasma lucivorax]
MNKFISPLTWPGGKAKQWNLIKSYFPKNTERMRYIEPFFGGGSIGLNALREDLFRDYTFNDINTDLINFWKGIMSDKNFLEMYKPILKLIFHPKVKTLDEIKSIYAEIERETPNHWLLFLLKNNLTFNGSVKGTWTQQRLEQNWNHNKFERVLETSKLLNKKYWSTLPLVHFENNPAQGSMFFGKYNSKTWMKNTFYYIDPPYFEIKNLYEYSMSQKQWKKFKGWIREINNYGAKFCISLNDCPEVREMFKEFNIYEAAWKYTSSNTKNCPIKIGKELIITNYEIKE